MILEFWLTSSIVVGFGTCYAIWREEGDFDKDKLSVIAAMTAFGPLSLCALFAVIMHEHFSNKIRQRCNRIMTEWETRARKGSIVNRFDWYTQKAHQEERYNMLRNCIREMSDRDLELLSRVGKSTYEIEKPLRESIIDELLERRILNHD